MRISAYLTGGENYIDSARLFFSYFIGFPMLNVPGFLSSGYLGSDNLRNTRGKPSGRASVRALSAFRTCYFPHVREERLPGFFASPYFSRFYARCRTLLRSGAPSYCDCSSVSSGLDVFLKRDFRISYPRVSRPVCFFALRLQNHLIKGLPRLIEHFSTVMPLLYGGDESIYLQVDRF
jgi:hypothetical protein